MNKFNDTEKEKIVSRLCRLGLYDLADDFDSDVIPRVYNTRTGKYKSLLGRDIRRINKIEELFGSRTYLIIRAYDMREDIENPVDFFLGLDDSEYTEFINVDPQGGAVSAPAYYPGYSYPYGIESFMYNKWPESNAWIIITSIQLQPIHEFDDDTDDLPF